MGRENNHHKSINDPQFPTIICHHLLVHPLLILWPRMTSQVSTPEAPDCPGLPTSALTMPNKDTTNYLGTHVDPLSTQNDPQDPHVAPKPAFCTQTLSVCPFAPQQHFLGNK